MAVQTVEPEDLSSRAMLKFTVRSARRRALRLAVVLLGVAFLQHYYDPEAPFFLPGFEPVLLAIAGVLSVAAAIFLCRRRLVAVAGAFVTAVAVMRAIQISVGVLVSSAEPRNLDLFVLSKALLWIAVAEYAWVLWTRILVPAGVMARDAAARKRGP